VRATIHDRDVPLPGGSVLFRAQRGHDWRTIHDSEGNAIDDVPEAFGPERMKPRLDVAKEGRANPAGIPFLYLGTTEQTAISEVRPWVGAVVSVSQLKIARSLRLLDLTKGHGRSSIEEIEFKHLFGTEPVDAGRKERAVWIDIDNAFSRPVTFSDETADYAPTQILAELFRDEGYDGLLYKSQFGERGFNIVLFDIAAAEVVNGAPYEVTALEVAFKQSGDRWFRSSEPKSED
jgi:RES domain-containing protein